MLIGRFLYRQKVCSGIIEHDLHLLHENIYNHVDKTGERITRDTFGPCGPWISTECNPDNATTRMYLNGAIVQNDNTGDTIFSVTQILSFVSSFMTLWPGDLVITGTPSGIGQLQIGDQIEVEIEGIGGLLNPIKKSKQ